jgi:tetratricopeptide (TPR) repeat protein
MLTMEDQMLGHILLFATALSASTTAASPSTPPREQPRKAPVAELRLSPAETRMSPVAQRLEDQIFQADPAAPPPQEPAFLADPNETSSNLLFRYRRARRLIASGQWERARTLLQGAIAQYPESRNLHQLYAELLWALSQGTDPALLREAGREAVRAAELGLRFGTVDYRLNRRLADVLGRTGDKETFERIFAELLARDPGASVRLDYARGLRMMNDPGTEKALQRARAAEHGEGDALAEYGEWLIEQGRDRDALDLIPKSAELYYLNFLRAVALERSGSPQEARGEYLRFADFSSFFPAPARFRLPGTLQTETGIHFDDESSASAHDTGGGPHLITAPLTDSQGIQGLSYLLYGEAGAEPIGAMRAEGWVVRDRVLRGSVGSPSPCPYVTNSGSTLADQYKSVMCQGSGGQFNAVCLAWCSNPASSCTSSANSNSVAYDIFYGYAPDPVSGHCPGGISTAGTGLCDAARTCVGNLYTYRMTGPLFNYGTTGTCPTLCAPTSNGKTCGNGGRDNCFYSNNYCPGTSYANTLAATGAYRVTDPLNSPAGTHFGHLDGPESQDFDLILESAPGSTGPWSRVVGSEQVSSVEQINYYAPAGWYRWKVISYSGSGSFTFCAKDP